MAKQGKYSNEGSEHVSTSPPLSRLGEQSQLDFEIDFFAGILERRPDFVDVLRVMGNNLTLKGRYVQGLGIDKKLVKLLNERSQCALEIGKLKQAAKIPLYQPERENEVLANAESNNAGPLTDAAIRRLFERIIDEARAAERDAMHRDGSSGKKGNE